METPIKITETNKMGNFVSTPFPINPQTSYGILFSKTCVKRPLKNRQNKNLNDKW